MFIEKRLCRQIRFHQTKSRLINDHELNFQINRIFAKIHKMVTIVKYGTDNKKIRSLLERLKNQKTSRIGIDAYKYCGVITLAEEPLLIQKELRNEWG